MPTLVRWSRANVKGQVIVRDEIFETKAEALAKIGNPGPDVEAATIIRIPHPHRAYSVTLKARRKD